MNVSTQLKPLAFGTKNRFDANRSILSCHALYALHSGRSHSNTSARSYIVVRPIERRSNCEIGEIVLKERLFAQQPVPLSRRRPDIPGTNRLLSVRKTTRTAEVSTRLTGRCGGTWRARHSIVDLWVEKQKSPQATDFAGILTCFWRREGDSNPR